MNQLRTFLDQLGPRRMMMMGGVAAVLLLGLAALALRGGGASGMGFLYTDLDPSVARSMTEKLQAQNVPFQLSEDGTAILAPLERLSELRMGMAGEKLGGKIGYDVLDEEEPFGVSASRARLNETRAIEGELARSIESLEDVTRARVHLVMPEREIFATEARRASAAVTVRTRARLSAEAVQSIRYLVASSVPALTPEAVSVVDQRGALLARSGEAGEANAASADERQAAVEAKLRHEIEALLEPIVGAGKVRAEVSADIDRDHSREESNVFDPDRQVIGRQVTVESDDRNSEAAAGAQAATVASQLPENQDQPVTGGSGDTRNAARRETSEDTTYQNSATHRIVTRTPGRISRLTVAVLVDGGPKGLPPAQVRRLQRLVENAVGADAERGDSVLVESMSFAAAGADLADREPSLLDTIGRDQIFELLKLLLLGGVVLVALRMLRPKVAPAAGPASAGERLLDVQRPTMLAPAEQAAEGGTAAAQRVEALQQGSDLALLDQEIALAQVDGRIKASALKRLGETIAASAPESAAVIRQWMNA